MPARTAARRTNGSSTATICHSDRCSSKERRKCVSKRFSPLCSASRAKAEHASAYAIMCVATPALAATASRTIPALASSTKLDQRRRVAIEDHRSPRCSFTISDSVCSPGSMRKIGLGRRGFTFCPGVSTTGCVGIRGLPLLRTACSAARVATAGARRVREHIARSPAWDWRQVAGVCRGRMRGSRNREANNRIQRRTDREFGHNHRLAREPESMRNGEGGECSNDER
jgi:hypothetical protein